LNNYIKYAEQLIEKGLSVTPVRDKKSNFFKGWSNVFESDILDKKYSGFWQQSNGLGLMLGKQPGVICLDIDILNTDERLKYVRKEILEMLPPVFCGLSGNPRKPPARLYKYNGEKATKFNSIDVELLVDGNQKVIPPSIHPDTKKEYVWVGKSLYNIDVDDLPDLPSGILEFLDKKNKEFKASANSKGVAIELTSEKGRCKHGSHNYLSSKLVALFYSGLTFESLVDDALALDAEINEGEDFLYFLCPSRKEFRSNDKAENAKQFVKQIEENHEAERAKQKSLDEFRDAKNTYDLFGYDEEGYYFYSDRSKMIKRYSVSSIKQGLLVEMASEYVWARDYTAHTAKNKETEVVFDTDRCNWAASAGDIIADQQGIGKYKPGKIRGTGSWVDGSDCIVNLGDKLLVNGEVKSLDDHEGNYFYYPDTAIDVDFNNNVTDFSKLFDFIDLVDFKEEVDRVCFVGFIAQSILFSTQRWRSYVWLLAPKGSGKSSLMEFLSNLLHSNIATQDATVAGLRQTAGSNACTVLYDEAEGEQNKSKRLLEFARGCSSQSNFKAMRGTPNGRSLMFNDQLLFCLASIRQPDFTAADESRWLNVRLDAKQYSNVDRISRDNDRAYAMKEALKLKDDLFVFVNKNIPKFNELKDEVSISAKLLGLSSRQADQYSNFIAGYSLLSAEPVDDVLVRLELEQSEDIKNDDNDYDDMMNVFLDTLIRHNNKSTPLSKLLSDLISVNFVGVDSCDIFESLRAYGVFFSLDKTELRISNNHELRKLIANSSIYPNIYRALKNHPKMSGIGSKRNDKLIRKCVCFKITDLADYLTLG